MTNGTRPNTCIRTCRDERQITRCRQQLKTGARSLSQAAGKLNLLGNDTRLKILSLLRTEHRLCVCDLAEILAMTVPAVSQHLKKLREGGLIETEQEGVTVYNRLAPNALPFLQHTFQLLAPTVAV